MSGKLIIWLWQTADKSIIIKIVDFTIVDLKEVIYDKIYYKSYFHNQFIFNVMNNLHSKIFLVSLFLTLMSSYGQSWVQLGNAIPGSSAYDYSSRDVSITSNGLRIAIGAERNDGNGTNSGQVRVYEYFDTLGWYQIGYDIYGQGSSNYFGTSVSLSSDGSIVAIGAIMNYGSSPNTGYVQIYENTQTFNWVQKGGDILGTLDMDKFGSSISLNADGTRVAIGATQEFGVHIGFVRVYDFDAINGWVQIGNDIVGDAKFDEFGYSIMINDDGSRVIVGAPFNSSNGDNSGQAKVYELNNNEWIQLGEDFLGENAEDELGYSISINSDGSVIAIGAPQNDDNGLNAGQVKVYKYNNIDGWIQVGGDLNGVQHSRFGYAVSLDDVGNTLAVGAYLNSEIEPAAGKVKIYKYDETVGWTQWGQDINGTSNSQLLGQAVALNSSGNTVVIGAQSSGETTLQRGETSVFVFDETVNVRDFKKRKIAIYPNPTSGLIKINYPDKINKIQIYNELGQILLSNIGEPEMDISLLDRGLYFVKIFSENGQIQTKKVVKR